VNVRAPAVSTPRRWRTRGRVLLTPLLFLGATLPAHAQGCAMCLTSATAQGARAMESMNAGILVLLVPPLAIIVGVLGFTFLRRP